MVWNTLWSLVTDKMSWSTQSVLSQGSDTSSRPGTPPSSWEEEFIFVKEPESIDPLLLERTENMSCCWFDITLEGVSQKAFERLFAKYPEGTYRTRFLCCVNSCILYGVWIDAEAKSRGDVAIVEHDAPEWVYFLHPIGDEGREPFFERLAGSFLRTAVEPLDGFSVADML